MISQNLRSHITWKCKEADFYLGSLRAISQKVFTETRQFGFSWLNPEHQKHAQAFLFLFSGLSSAFRCVTFYIEDACRKGEPPSLWYEQQKEALRKQRGLLV